ncbi:MAG: hypothetical protein DBX47_02655 [Clostridiales bacterium]|nr:MAG: hypothetical protein DBX47_02655 [Clostridiales bacterium]
MKKWIAAVLLITIILTAIPFSFSAAEKKPAAPAETLYNKNIETPVIIETKYPSTDTVVADYIITNPEYNADFTGVVDCSDIIQKAINDCRSTGGGTVFMPAGKYLVTKTLTLASNVTLLGDYSDTLGEFGTVILCDTPVTDNLFVLNPSSGIKGLTVYYPKQSLENVIPYAPTVKVAGGMMFTVQNCTFLNSYDGIVTGGHEMLTVDTLKGTFLHNCIDAKNQSDVGTFKNISVSPKYWASAGAEYKAPEEAAINEYTKANLTGLRLGDLEWAEFLNIELYGCNIGVHTVDGERVQFCGQFYDIRVYDSVISFYAERFDVGNWGIEFSNCYLQGSTAAFKNDMDGSPIKAAATVFDGKIDMKNDYSIYKKTETLPSVEEDYYAAAKKPQAYLYNLADYGVNNKNEEDISEKLQAALDDAKSTGGVVYIPAGNYRLENPVIVPAGVELRGSGATPRRMEDGATNIFVYYGKNLDKLSSAAVVTLNGDGAGLKQLGFIYPENYPVYDPKTDTFSYADYAFTIEANKADNYIENCAIAASANAIHLKGANNHFIKKVISAVYYNTFYIENSQDGRIEGCLHNGTLASRIGSSLANADKTLAAWTWGGYHDENKAIYPEFMFNIPISATLNHITLKNVKNEKIINVFTFGSYKYFTSYSSSSLLINVGADYFKGDRMLSVFENSDILVMNLMRVTSQSRGYYSDNTGRLQIYSQMKAGAQTERDEAHFYNVLKGDLDESGKVSLVDAMNAFRYVAGKFEKRPLELFMYAADIDGNNKVALEDAMAIFRIVAGKE